ncbi:MAG TPA: universal stress protein [Verrucomicrobiae bacterium]
MKTKRANIPALDLSSILVPVDFSDDSVKAVRYAVAMAEKTSAKITLLHVIYLHYIAGELGPVDIPVLETQMKETTLKKMTTFAQEHVPARLLQGTAVVNGPVVPEITAFAQTQKTGLIVVSTHGNTGLKRFVLGSVAENVVRHAPCPVLVVREQEQEFIHEQRA